jgi:hypothetical protein
MIHHEEGDFALDAEFEDAHDIGMRQVSDGPGLGTELVDVLAHELRMEHFNSGLGAEMNMLTEVDISKTSLT